MDVRKKKSAVPDKRLELTHRQRKFLDNFSGNNGTEAAKVAGYRNPAVEASRLLANDKILKALRSREKEQFGGRILDRDQCLRLLSDIARGEVEDNHITVDGKVVSRPARLETRIRAIEDILRAGGYFTDKLQLSGADGQPLSIKIEFVGVGPAYPVPTAEATPKELLEADPAERPSLLIDFEPRKDELEPPS